jgi:hypothetical protein
LDACDTPTGLAVGNIAQTSAQASWSAVTGANFYTARYRLKDSTTLPYTWVAATSISKWFITLSAGTDYEIQVRTNCASSNSDWSALVYFTTEAACNTPTGLFEINIASSFARTNWNVVAGVANYILKFREDGTSNLYTWKLANSNSKWLVGLAASTSYEYEVRATCATSNSLWAGPEVFTTSGPKSGNGNVGNGALRIDVYPNPADEAVFINFSVKSAEPILLKAYDMLGRTLIQRDMEMTEGTIKIVTNTWPAGQYLVQIGSDKEFVSKKFMIVD